MSLDTSPLFSSLKVRNKTFRNRIVMPPMVVLRGLTTQEGIAWYGQHARGGVSLVIMEATGVNGFGSKLTAENLKPIVQAIHEGGALAAIQLFPVTFGRSVSPAEVSREEMEEIVGHYEKATQICKEAGMDGVEPHGAHGYLLNQFFSPEENKRTDEYAGDLENRMRYSLRIVDTVRQVCGQDMLLLYRHTPVGPGYGIPESLQLAERLVKAGVDILDISPSSQERPGDRSEPFRKLGVPVITVWGLDDVPRAVEALTSQRADLVAVGRGLIADPEWPNKVKEGRLSEIVQCTKCDEKCFGNLSKGIPVECTQW